jgi:hypothetical protein
LLTRTQTGSFALQNSGPRLATGRERLAEKTHRTRDESRLRSIHDRCELWVGFFQQPWSACKPWLLALTQLSLYLSSTRA